MVLTRSIMLPGQNGIEKGAKKKLPMEKAPLQIKRKDIRNHDISNYDILFARIALKQKLITKKILAKVFSFQKKEKVLGNLISIDDILVANKAITKEQCDIIRCEMKNVESFDGEKEPIKDSTIPNREPDNKNTGQLGASIKEMIKLVVSENKLEARIRIKKDISGKIIPDDIIGFLNQNDIIFGVESLEQIAAFLNADADEEKIFLVAKGKPATLGCDASIEYHFDTDHLKAGAVNEDGNINFRERGGETPGTMR